jgi:hypothetical protein
MKSTDGRTTFSTRLFIFVYLIYDSFDLVFPVDISLP